MGIGYITAFKEVEPSTVKENLEEKDVKRNVASK